MIEDENEALEERMTAQDIMLVNKNVFDFKYKTRVELLDNKCSLHVSNNIKETRHDFALLTGKSLEDFCKTNVLDGETIYLHQNLPCVDGWKDLGHIFYILNETVDYAVLRNFKGLPNEVVVDEHTDIDILVNDMQNFISVLEGAKLRDDVFKIRVYANIQGTEALFHCKYIGDDYYDAVWQRKILENRIKNDKNIYIPNKEDYFYSLLYHALYQKTYVSDTYLPIFKSLMPELNLENNLDIENLKTVMENYLKTNNYKITQPFENLNPELRVPKILLGEHNIRTKSLIDKEEKYFILKGKNGVSIFNKKLCGINSKNATKFIFFDETNRKEPFVNFPVRLYSLKSKELKHYKKYIKKNTLFVTFRKRYGQIALNECLMHGKKQIIKKKWITYPFKNYYINNFKVNTKEVHKYKPGMTITDYLKTFSGDTLKIEKMLEIYIGLVFEKFRHKDSSLLQSRAFDMTTDNCIIDEKGNFEFFDFEYEYIKPLEKSFVVYRIIKNCHENINHKKLYDEFCKKLNLENKYYYWESIEIKQFKGVNSPKSNPTTRMLACFIPSKKKRKKFREKYILNYGKFKKIFGKDCFNF